MSLFDPGLQPERTALSWQRTCLALLVGSLTAARVALPTAGGWALGAGALGSVCALAMMWLTRRRYRTSIDALGRPEPHLPTDGLLPALASAMTLAGALFLTITLALIG
ncbi:DUF202 domain-containing protein [Luteococcus sp. OSA5]|uniref:DUF202 domain-containing protein n=1 Tax=Luteococcus sp. OSA5 TaxID=3401630 RepID=UPI003B4382F1